MQRTNIYLDEAQLAALRRVAEVRRTPVAALVREAIAEWLDEHGIQAVPDDEWARRFDRLLARRDTIQQEIGFSEDEVVRDVMAAVDEVREERAAGRRRH
jgi:hypothetical protein